VADSSFEVAFALSARAYYDALPALDRTEIDAIREAIEADPSPDGQLKRALGVLDLFVYEDERWAVLYEMSEPGHISIGEIARTDQPRSWRPS